MNNIKLPGLIDPHVHLRDPGQTDKEDFLSGTSAAIAGGFTAVIDMPNNKVPIATTELLKAKQNIAKKQIVSDVGFYFGTVGDNLDEFEASVSRGGALGLKVYLNQTTGNFLLDKHHLENIFKRWPEDRPILFHAEDETFDSVLEVLKKYPRKIHLCHMSTGYELKRVIEAKKTGLPVTCGVTPHHLFLSEKHFQQYGSFAMMRPPLRPQADVDFLWENIASIDMIESDHAPHTREEKINPPASGPPNGIPGLETTLPLLLTAVSHNALKIEDIIRLCHDGPKTVFGIDQGDETFIEVAMDEKYVIDQTKLLSKAKWTPFNGWKVQGRIKRTVLRGTIIYENNRVIALPGSGNIL